MNGLQVMYDYCLTSHSIAHYFPPWFIFLHRISGQLPQDWCIYLFLYCFSPPTTTRRPIPGQSLTRSRCPITICWMEEFLSSALSRSGHYRLTPGLRKHPNLPSYLQTLPAPAPTAGTSYPKMSEFTMTSPQHHRCSSPPPLYSALNMHPEQDTATPTLSWEALSLPPLDLLYLDVF